MSLEDCRVIDLPRHEDRNGNLTVIESGIQVPFEIKRVFYLYDVPGGARRGGHAHRRLEQLVIAMSGSFDFELDDGFSKRRVHFNRSYRGLYIPRMIWREMDNFSSGAVCMVLTSEHYDAGEYIRDYDEFQGLARSR